MSKYLNYEHKPKGTWITIAKYYCVAF